MEKYIKLVLSNNKEYVISLSDNKFNLSAITDGSVDWIKLQEVNRDKNSALVKVNSIMLIEEMDKGMVGRQTKIFKLGANDLI